LCCHNREINETTMKKTTLILIGILIACLTLLSSCEREDPGPIQRAEKNYSLIDFDRLEMGSAFHIEVEQANTYSIHVKGDRRNLDDLEVYKSGTTLIIRFDENANRSHDTYITITMPRLEGINFSGASVSTITGFESDDDLEFILSGASVSQLDAGYREVDLTISGASSLVMHGLGDELEAEVSGASILSAFDFPVRDAEIKLTGASQGKVTVTDELDVEASGASALLYRGNPSVTSNTSGNSSVNKD
jgi:Putative auto-transporter adhesin, head GIN domain